MNEPTWRECLEKIAKGLGGTFEADFTDGLYALHLPNHLVPMLCDVEGIEELDHLYELESLVIAKVGEDAFAEVVFNSFIAKWMSDKLDKGEELKRTRYLEIYRADALTRARILARVLTEKGEKENG